MSFDIFDIAGSGMHAQRVMMDTVSSNIANANTTRNAKGGREVYTKKEVTFKAVYKDSLRPKTPTGSHDVQMDLINGPYLRGRVVFQEDGMAQGVMVDEIRESENPYRMVYDPTHPDADENGMVQLPNVNVVEEMVNMVNASKAYEANVTIAQTTKTMIQSALQI